MIAMRSGYELVGVVRDAEILHAPFGLPAAQRLQMRVEIDEVVHLHEFDALVLEQRHRALHLLDALLLAMTAGPRRPHLRRDEHLGLLLRREQVAEHGLGGRIHRRGVDERGAAGEKRLQHFAQRRARSLVGADFERAGSAETDGRNGFAGRRNAPHEQLAGRDDDAVRPGVRAARRVVRVCHAARRRPRQLPIARKFLSVHASLRTRRSDQRGIGSHDGVAALRDDLFERQRLRQYLRGVEMRARDLAPRRTRGRSPAGELVARRRPRRAP